jgi:flagellar basal-body rod protein FlgF
MSDGIYSALSGAIAQQRALDAVGNNLANVNTTGFQADKPIFATFLNKDKDPRKIAPALNYATVNQLAVDVQPGSLKLTGRPLDVALHGDGYFTVKTPNGERYTRAGSFTMDRDGTLKTPGGFEVMAESVNVGRDTDATIPGQRIVLPLDSKEISIAPDGTISADGRPMYRFKMVSFDNQDDAVRDGLTLFTSQTGKQPRLSTVNTTVEQGYLEAANVNAVSGMNELINVQRHFDALEKVIDTFRELDDRTARDVAGKV